MRKGLVALALAAGSVVIPAPAATASHCPYPFIQPNPVQDPAGWVQYHVRQAQWLVCELTHR